MLPGLLKHGRKNSFRRARNSRPAKRHGEGKETLSVHGQGERNIRSENATA